MTTPTDAELNELLGKHWPAFALQGAVPLTWLRSAMREAIAKWGQPQAGAGGEPVGWVDDGGDVFWKASPPPDGCDLYTAPPPQAVREPLTPEQIAEGFANRPRSCGLFAGGVRFAERHHGITKGGQHG